MISLDQLYAKYNGQSLLYPGTSSDLRGQCVVAMYFVVDEVWGRPIFRANAKDWLDRAAALGYQVVRNNPNDPNQVPPRGAIAVWGGNLPGSGGYGHVAAVWDARPRAATFIGLGSNWGGKTLHLVTHNYNYLLGWIMPPAAPAPQPQGDEMIANGDQATKIYRMLRPNGGASQAEIDATAGRRSFGAFLNDAQAEVSARDANLRAQAQHMIDLQNTINSLNQTITDLRTSEDAEDIEQNSVLKAATDKIAMLTGELETAHDKLKDLQDKLPTANPTPEPEGNETPNDPSFIVKLIAWFLNRKK